MTNLVLFDMDGTLSDDTQRQHLYLEKRYTEYFSYDAQMSDAPYPEGRALFDAMQVDGWVAGVLTARLERNSLATFHWLQRESYVLGGPVILRPESQHTVRPPVFKSSVLRGLIESGEYEHVILVDNDPLVVAQVTADLGSEHVMFADWDRNPQLASIANPGAV
jgi:hypothetical protein